MLSEIFTNVRMKIHGKKIIQTSNFQEKMQEHSNPDFGQIETIHDQERWAIQKCRLASRPMVRISRKTKNKVSFLMYANPLNFSYFKLSDYLCLI